MENGCNAKFSGTAEWQGLHTPQDSATVTTQQEVQKAA